MSVTDTTQERLLSQNGSSSSITLTEVFDLDVARYLVGNQDIDYTTRTKIKWMIKNKKKINELEITYRLGKSARDDSSGRWFTVRGQGLQGLARNFRNALAAKYYWDVDIVNAQVVLLLQICEKLGLECSNLREYCENREQILLEMCEETKQDRASIKERFVALLFGGQPRGDDPAWMKSHFFPEVKQIMKNIARENPKLYKKCIKRAPTNPTGSCAAIFLQTEERKCLMTLEEFFILQNRSMEVLIHDGGYVRKLPDEKKFPEHLIKDASDYIFTKTRYRLDLALKPIINEIQIPNKITLDENKTRTAIKTSFEKTNFKCMKDSMFYSIENGKIIVRSQRELIIAYENLLYDEIVKDKLVKKQFLAGKYHNWFTDPAMRQYDEVVMLPPPLICPPNAYNLWQGFPVQLTDPTQKVDISLFLDHIKLLCDLDINVFQYVLHWLAHVFQKPGIPIGIGLLFKSGQGIGKNTLYDLLNKMIGSEFSDLIDNPERDVFGSFNPSIRNKVLLVFDEFSGSTGYAYSDRLKSLVTSTINKINQKNVKGETCPSFLHTMFFTNNNFPVKLESDDRRFLPIVCNQEKKPASYFIELRKQIESPVHRRAFYDHLMNMSIENMDWENTRPITEYSMDMKIMSRPVELQFLIHHLSEAIYDSRKANFNGSIRDEIYRINAKNLASCFKEYLNDNNIGSYKYSSISQKLGIFIKNLNVEGFDKHRKGQEYEFNLNRVKEWMETRGYFT